MGLLIGWLGYSIIASHANVFAYHDINTNKTHGGITINQLLETKKVSTLKAIENNKADVPKINQLKRKIHLYNVGLVAGKIKYPVCVVGTIGVYSVGVMGMGIYLIDWKKIGLSSL